MKLKIEITNEETMHKNITFYTFGQFKNNKFYPTIVSNNKDYVLDSLFSNTGEYINFIGEIMFTILCLSM